MNDDVELVTELSSLLLADAPGTGYRYSNVGYALLGEVIEAATGTGETFRFDGGTLFSSGLAYGRRP